MSRTFVVLALLLLSVPALAAVTATSEDMKAVYEYGDALYHAYQGEWFDAIARLDAIRRDHPNGSNDAEAGETPAGSGRLVGDFELNYRMDNRAGRAIESVIENTGRDDLRNIAVFRLARMYFEKDQPTSALRAIERVRGAVPKSIRPDLSFLRANILMANGRNAEAAAILKGLLDEKKLQGFSSYNLGIALLRTGDEQGGRKYLDLAGRTESDDRAVLAIRDKANLVLGEMLLGEKNYGAAREVLDRVRLNGPFSDRALLSSGWAEASQDRFEKALVPWSILAGRQVTDPAVQEALLAVPYAYSRLGVFSTAALKYEAALQAFGKEIDKLDISIASIRQGMFLDDLARAHLQQDADWIVNLRNLPETPKTAYLLDLMASNDFQEGLRNYLDLQEIRKKLDAWSGDLVAFEDIMRKRRAHYEPLLPVVDRELATLAAQRKAEGEKRDRIAKELDALQAKPDPEPLISADERSMREELAKLEGLVTPHTEEIAPGYLERLRRLKGVLYWNTHANYDQRYAETREHLRDLDRQLEGLDREFQAFARTRRTAVESYEGHDDVIARDRSRIEAARKKVPGLIALEGQVLETMAENELTRRRGRLEDLRVKARFGLADSYDRAAKAQGRKSAP